MRVSDRETDLAQGPAASEVRAEVAAVAEDSACAVAEAVVAEAGQAPTPIAAGLTTAVTPALAIDAASNSACPALSS